jgi:GT2 family glycosyltransferase
MSRASDSERPMLPAAAYLTRARQLAEKGDREKATTLLQHLTALDPGYGPAWDDLGTLLAAAGKKEEALACYEKAVVCALRDPAVFKRYAGVALELGRVEDAARQYERYLSRFPDDPETLVGSAYLRMRLGQFEQAENLVARAAAVAPHHAEARSFLQTLRASRAVRPDAADENYPFAVSVIIPSFKNVDQLRRCLDSIYRQSGEESFEVVVVDNGSTTETLSFLNAAAKTYPHLNLLSNAVNLGFARACNQGSRAARGRHFLFLNNDTEVRPDWLRALLDVMDNDPAVGAVGAKLLFPNGTVQHAGVVVLNDQSRDLPLSVTHFHLRGRADDPEVNEPKSLQAVTGACVLMRREAFAQAGGFDEGYWNGFEDVDLCFKMRDRGWLLVYEPRCVVIHHEMQGGTERTIRFAQNANRLSDRWVGKIVADAVIVREGQAVMTDGAGVRPYVRPQQPARETP